jgi:hypothetical protein
MAEQGQEITEGDPAVCEKVWLRFAEFEVKGGQHEKTVDES